MQYDLATLDTGVFRAYDIRGIVGQSLTEPLVYHLGRAFAASAHAQGIGEVVVAADGRLSGPRLKEVLTAGSAQGWLRRGGYRLCPHSGALLCRSSAGSPDRYHDHRQPQSGRLQRLQDDARRPHPFR